MLISNEPPPNFLFEYSGSGGADIVLRSHDSHHFRVPKSYIIDSSPVLKELIHETLDIPNGAGGEASHPLVQLTESGAILHSLLTFIFPVTTLVPSTAEDAMELLSVAQKYQMVSVLAHIRDRIARQNPPFTKLDSAVHIYSLAQKYGLREEALQAAQIILKYPMDIADLEDKLDIMPGPSLYELWKFYQNTRAILASDLMELGTSSSGVSDALEGFSCSAATVSSQIPRWLDDYIKSIGDAPHLFDFVEFNMTLAHHIRNGHRCSCESIPNQTIRNVWEALATVVHSSFEKVSEIHVDESLTTLMPSQAGSSLSLVQGREASQARANPITFPPAPLDIPDANLIVRSSDHVNFGIHKSILVMVSPFFGDLLSIPQPSDSESVDGLPVVQFSEDAELLSTLVSMLYPVRRVIPDSYEKVLNLLAACQKYDMVQVQSSIRAKVNRGTFPAPVGTEGFRAYAIACNNGLVPEMEKAAHMTLDHPMTLETLGEALIIFDGSALRDLARFRERCRDNLVLCLMSSLESQGTGEWYCPSCGNWSHCETNLLHQALSPNNSSKKQAFTDPVTPLSIHGEYLKALASYARCHFCGQVQDSTLSADLESKLAQARDKVHTFLLISKYLRVHLSSSFGYVVTCGKPSDST